MPEKRAITSSPKAGLLARVVGWHGFTKWLKLNFLNFVDNRSEKLDHTSYMIEMLGISNSVPEGKRSEFASRVTPRLKNPTSIFGFSVFLGFWGADRFLLGQTLMGVLKIITGGGLGIWVLIDWFTIAGKTRDMNIAVAREVAQSI